MEIQSINEEQMRAHIKAWSSSGQSKKKYCKLNKVHYHKFLYRGQKDLSKETISSASFKQIDFNSDVSIVEIHYPSGIIVKLNQSINLQILKSLL